MNIQKFLFKVMALMLIGTPLMAQINLVGGVSGPMLINSTFESKGYYYGALSGQTKNQQSVEMASSLVLGIEIENNLNENISWLVGLTVQPAKPFTKSNNDKNVSYHGDGHAFIDLGTLYLRMNYIINSFYLFGGVQAHAINVRHDDYDGYSQILLTFPSYHCGTGFKLTDAWSIEMTYWKVNGSSQLYDENDNNEYFGNFIYDSNLITATTKYTF